MLLYIKRAPPKVPKTRSRAGCEHCRIKKKKCDEGRPDCTRCKDLGQECIYGQPRPRVRRSSSLLPPADLDRDPSLSVLPVRQMSASPQCTPAAPAPASLPLPSPLGSLPSSSTGDGRELAAAAGAGLLFPIDADDEVLFANILDENSFQIPLPAPQEEDVVPATTAPTPPPLSRAVSSSPSRALTRRPSLPCRSGSSNAGMAFYAATPHLELNMPLFSEYTNIKGRRALLDHFANVISHLIVLREDQGDNPFQQLVLPMSRQSPAVASAIYALSSAHLEFRGVGGGSGSGGSWEQRKSILFHTEAARNLANLIEKGAHGNQNELLAAVMLLIYYEVLVHRERSHIVTVHLKGAMAILNSAPGISDPTRAFLERAFRFYDVIAALSFRSSTLSDAPASDRVGPFLPVDSRGASRPLGSADALLGMATSLWPIVHRLSNLGALKDELIAAVKAGDEKAPRLRAELKTAAVAIEASLTAWEPEFPLDHDDGAGSGGGGGGGGHQMTGAFRGILHNALAYRHSSLVHLYRSIYGAKRQHPMVQEHTRASLKFCLGTVDSAGPMGALLWPLFVAACEAQGEADREMATMAFKGIERHQGMANIAHSWMIVQEVWRRADEAEVMDQFLVADSEDEGDEDDGTGELVLGNRSSKDRLKDMEFNLQEEDLWRQVCRDMGLSVVFG